MKKIPLTQGQFALVDDEDFERVNQFKWQALFQPSNKSFYAVRSERVKGKRILVYMSRFIMNTPKGLDCDHINQNTLDNRKANLRNCTRSQNLANRKSFTNKKIAEKGIRQLPNGRFQVMIVKDKKVFYVKNFPTLDDAKAAFAIKYKELHGDFARIE